MKYTKREQEIIDCLPACGKDIGATIGMGAAQVSKTMQRLQRLGVVQITGKKFVPNEGQRSTGQRKIWDVVPTKTASNTKDEPQPKQPEPLLVDEDAVVVLANADKIRRLYEATR